MPHAQAPAGGAAVAKPVARLSMKASRWLLPTVATLVVFGLLELVVRAGVLPRTSFPTPTEVVRTLGTQVQQGPYWTAVWETLEGWGLGLGLGILAAIPAGLLIGTNAWLYRSARFVIDFVRPIPSIALLPLFILLFGLTLTLKVYLAALGAFFPLLFQTIYGAQDVDPVARDTARAYGLGRMRRFVFIELPGATPYIATGLRISASVALVVSVAAEVLVGVPGLGASVYKAQYAGHLDVMYALIATSGVLGLIITFGFNRIERVTLKWHPSQRGDRPT
jgi:ABC-type nitrate/sulfonate/bicarbonate transport system permease component